MEIYDIIMKHFISVPRSAGLAGAGVGTEQMPTGVVAVGCRKTRSIEARETVSHVQTLGLEGREAVG